MQATPALAPAWARTSSGAPTNARWKRKARCRAASAASRFCRSRRISAFRLMQRARLRAPIGTQSEKSKTEMSIDIARLAPLVSPFSFICCCLCDLMQSHRMISSKCEKTGELIGLWRISCAVRNHIALLTCKFHLMFYLFCFFLLDSPRYLSICHFSHCKSRALNLCYGSARLIAARAPSSTWSNAAGDMSLRCHKVQYSRAQRSRWAPVHDRTR